MEIREENQPDSFQPAISVISLANNCIRQNFVNCSRTNYKFQSMFKNWIIFWVLSFYDDNHSQYRYQLNQSSSASWNSWDTLVITEDLKETMRYALQNCTSKLSWNFPTFANKAIYWLWWCQIKMWCSSADHPPLLLDFNGKYSLSRREKNHKIQYKS